MSTFSYELKNLYEKKLQLKISIGLSIKKLLIFNLHKKNFNYDCILIQVFNLQSTLKKNNMICQK